MKSSATVGAVVCSLIAANLCMASTSRVGVLGPSDGGAFLDDGSFVTDDLNNWFANPAMLVGTPSVAIIEKSNGLDSGRGQGGFVAGFDGFAAGAYFNRGSAIREPYNNLRNMRPVDVAIAAELGTRWGLGVTYGSQVNSSSAARDFTARLGAATPSGIEPFVAYKIHGYDSTGGVSTSYSNAELGARYRWGEWFPHLGLRKSTRETVAGLGLGRSTRVADGLHLSYALGFWRVGTKGAGNRLFAPLTLGFEGTAFEWLVLRAGLQFRPLDKVTGTATGAGSADDTTLARLGATAKLGRFDLDWGFGNLPAGSGNLDGETFDFSNGFFALASLSYRI